MFLAGDVGGTKVILALFDGKEKLSCLQEKKYKSRDFPDFLSLLKDFMGSLPTKEISSMCFGVAGPIQKGRSQEINLPWVIDNNELSQALNLKNIWLINDLEANAWGLRMLGKDEIFVINAGKESAGNQALISAGTGLGEAGLYWDGITHRPFACEGGHVDFAPRDEEEIDLLRYLQHQLGRVSCERVLSGAGIYRLYRFLVDTKRAKENPDILAIATKDEPQREILNRAVDRSCTTCMRVIRLFVSLYGAEAGNLALKFLSRGGIFLGGGIAPHLIPFFHESTFMKSFTAKGRFASLLSSMPVKIVLNERTALLGAACYAQDKT